MAPLSGTAGLRRKLKISPRLWRFADCFSLGPNVEGAENEKLAEKVWDELVERLEKIKPGVTRV